MTNFINLGPLDIPRVIDLLIRNNLPVNIPGNGIYIGAELGNELIGMIGIRKITFIEPLISENPIVAVKLWTAAQNFIENNFPYDTPYSRIICLPEKEKTFIKAGFETVFPNHIIMEKNNVTFVR